MLGRTYLRGDVAVEKRGEDVALEAGAPDEIAVVVVLFRERHNKGSL